MVTFIVIGYAGIPLVMYNSNMLRRVFNANALHARTYKTQRNFIFQEHCQMFKVLTPHCGQSISTVGHLQLPI